MFQRLAVRPSTGPGEGGRHGHHLCAVSRQGTWNSAALGFPCVIDTPWIPLARRTRWEGESGYPPPTIGPGIWNALGSHSNSLAKTSSPRLVCGAIFGSTLPVTGKCVFPWLQEAEVERHDQSPPSLSEGFTCHSSFCSVALEFTLLR